jgi:hypothetical protein
MWELFSKNAPKNRKKPLLSGMMTTVLLIPQWFDCHDFHEHHGVGEHQSKPDPEQCYGNYDFQDQQMTCSFTTLK